MYCLDTTFLIDWVRERIKITKNIKNILNSNEIIAITPFSIFELYHGIYSLKRKDPNFNFRKEKIK